MDSKKVLQSFGKCYNSNDYRSLQDLLSSNIMYESYDCMYKVASVDKVIEVLQQSTKQNTYAHSGYYMYKGLVLKHLQECVLICDEYTLECIRIVGIKAKRGKIVNITGYKPSEYRYTRGKKIDG